MYNASFRQVNRPSCSTLAPEEPICHSVLRASIMKVLEYFIESGRCSVFGVSTSALSLVGICLPSNTGAFGPSVQALPLVIL